MSVLFSLVMAIPGLAKAFLDWQVQKANVLLDGFKVGAGIDLAAYQSYLNALVETNRIKLQANAWWGAKLIILTAGWTASLQFAAIMLDSMPFWIPFFMDKAHVVGSWGVPKPPPPYDGYQRDILLSFFIIAPAAPLISAVTQWLGRKR